MTPSPMLGQRMQPSCGGLANEARQCFCGTECEELKAGYLASLKARIQELEGALRDSTDKLGQVAAWLERLATAAGKSAQNCSFESLREAYIADANNYRKTAADINGLQMSSPEIGEPENEGRERVSLPPSKFSPGDPVEIRGAPEIDEIVIRHGDVHIEQMSADGWFMGIDACDGSYWQFWFGAKNRKSHVEFRHTETVPPEENAALALGPFPIHRTTDLLERD